MKRNRLIFVTNDDGFASKGFGAVIETARKFGDVVAIAPERPQSGMSQAITIYNPLYLRTIRKEAGLEIYSLSGTPVDCVKMGFDHMLRGRKVDLVISGINHGSNSAVNVLYSGTMGAAIEGSFYECPSIGLSLISHDENADFTASMHFGERIIRAVLDGEVRMPLCLNVNVPVGGIDEIRGIRVCRQTRGFWREEFFRRQDPHNRDYFWMTGEFVNGEPDAEDTDEWALSHNFVSVVPIQVDMTDYSQMGSVGRMFAED
ncbi:MAG: 5'/3'-nucleotidase SurE [Alistipes sp.]|nr:5'/3'-nucleotidase SurE [Alistipes sp.]